MTPKIRRKLKPKKLPKSLAGLQRINLNAAGIDISSGEHYAAVPPDRDPQPVQRFGGHTSELHRLARWLKDCGITTVAMESTSNYWVPLFQILETQGFEVLLVNARHVKNVPGKKTDVLDCQWLQELHTYGLLRGSFRPKDQVCQLRSYLRHRDNLVRCAGSHVQHMQKALTEMNLKLHHVFSDLTGLSAMAILDAILSGERDPLKLAALKDGRAKASTENIVHALEGDYRAEHLFALDQALRLYRTYSTMIAECDAQIAAQLKGFEARLDPQAAPLPGQATKKTLFAQANFEMRTQLYAICGVDLTRLPGFSILTTQALISELGLDMSRWRSEKHFSSWLNLSPGNKISGGKRLTLVPVKGHNRAADILRLCAYAAIKSKSALGAYGRRMKTRLGAPKAIKALAHKLARLLYRMLKHGTDYQEAGERYYEEKYQKHLLTRLHKQAASFGYQLTPATV
jgi:transposase